MTAQAILLSCGHPYVVHHQKGGRLIECKHDDCDERAIVQAVTIQTIEYRVTTCPPTLFENLAKEAVIDGGEIPDTG